MTQVRYQTFSEFYPWYLGQHADRRCRRAHFLGTSCAIAAIAQYIDSMNPWWLLAAVIGGYGGAWIGHLFFEHNRPASFVQPLYSFRADWVMYWQMLTGKLSW